VQRVEQQIADAAGERRTQRGRRLRLPEELGGGPLFGREVQAVERSPRHQGAVALADAREERIHVAQWRRFFERVPQKRDRIDRRSVVSAPAGEQIRSLIPAESRRLREREERRDLARELLDERRLELRLADEPGLEQERPLQLPLRARGGERALDRGRVDDALFVEDLPEERRARARSRLLRVPLRKGDDRDLLHVVEQLQRSAPLPIEDEREELRERALAQRPLRRRCPRHDEND
jgi:hypothetical protein